jgi:hypothetical protein
MLGAGPQTLSVTFTPTDGGYGGARSMAGRGGSSRGGSTTTPETTAGTYTFTVTGTGSPTVAPTPTTTFTVTVNLGLLSNSVHVIEMSAAPRRLTDSGGVAAPEISEIRTVAV